MRTEKSIKRSDVCVVMIDAYEGLSRDDARVINLVRDGGKGCIVLVNKWDLVSNVEMARYTQALIKKLDFLRVAPILFTSCKTGLNTDEVMPLIKLVSKNLKARFQPRELNDIMRFMREEARMPGAVSGGLAGIKRIKQVSSEPPTFILYVTKGTGQKKEFINAIKNMLHSELGLKGVPIRLIVRSTIKKR